MSTLSNGKASATTAATDNKAPIVETNPALISYYEALESRIGWALVTGNTRHAGYWDPSTKWPFPISAALRRMEANLHARLDLPAGSRVLDAGCGDGQVALFMASKGLRVVGIEVVPRHIENCWRNIRKAGVAGQMEVQYGDYHHLEHFPDESFDGIYTMETLLHASDHDAVLEGFYRVLKPGGRLVVHESEHPAPGEMGANGRIAEERAVIDEVASMPAHKVTTTGFYRKLLESKGFTDIKEEDLSENIKPLSMLIYSIAIVPVYIIKLLGLERLFINAVCSVRSFKDSPWTYVVLEATKPGGAATKASEEG